MLDASELRELDVAVRRICETGRPEGVPVLGSGEISIVVGWPPSAPAVAAKRLPVFPDVAAYAAYAELFTRYLVELRARGLDVVESQLVRLPNQGGPDHPGGVIAYCLQPILGRDRLATVVLRAAPVADRHPVIDGLATAIASCVDDRLGLDAQLSNWVVADNGSLSYLDVTTPFLRDESGRDGLDTNLFLAALPWVLRPGVRRFVVPGMLARYHDPRTVVLDVAVNLLRERLDPWLPALLDAARRRTAVHLTLDQVRHDYRTEARTWRALLLVRRLDRSWQRRIRHRPYTFLVPPRTGW